MVELTGAGGTTLEENVIRNAAIEPGSTSYNVYIGEIRIWTVF
jgi:hypothetical protein